MVDTKDLTPEQREQVCKEVLETSIQHAMGPIYLGQVIKGDEPRYITKEERAVVDAAIAWFDATTTVDQALNKTEMEARIAVVIKRGDAIIHAVKKLKGE